MTNDKTKIVLVSPKKSYKENYFSNHNMYDTYEEAREEIENPETSTHEVLKRDQRKIYLDIEGIPVDQRDLINHIVKDFIEFMPIPKDIEYVLTINEHSCTHKGLSYHLILPYQMNYLDMRRVIIGFSNKHPNYAKYIDVSVYSCIRLFRLPLNFKPDSKIGGLNKDDVHTFLRGTMKDAIIQLIDDAPNITLDKFDTSAITVSEADYKKIRGPVSQGGKSLNKTQISQLNSIFTAGMKELSLANSEHARSLENQVDRMATKVDALAGMLEQMALIVTDMRNDRAPSK